ncbi:MAG: histidine ammonia-lyase [Desulfobacteraceae bacterium]|nr:histidine ammonia-lyase [Desulfobacteraceae bacterium]
MPYSEDAQDMELGGKPVSVEDLVAIARRGRRVVVSDAALGPVARSRRLVEKWLGEGRVIYGITTGVGALCDVTIPFKDTIPLQKNTLLSHAAGVGEPFAEEVVRGTMAIRIHDLAQGYAGIRLETLTALADALNRGFYPVVPCKGSVGASGDLAPMAHIGLALTGEGEAFMLGRRVRAAEALAALGLQPVTLQAGEGLALINGTQVMTALAALAVSDSERLARIADVACAMSLEVLMGTNKGFSPRIHELRPHPGQMAAARNMARVTENSEIISSHKDCSRIQDAYTLRCSPQIHGASRDTFAHVRCTVEIEMNSTTTNPLIFSDTDEVLNGGNFHGQPIALCTDSMSMAVSELANVSERRTERLVNPQLSGLPAFLVKDTGLNTGFMIPQYTAAALVSENKTLCHPASVDSIPTSGNREDHVSMGTIAARKCRAVLENAEYVLAIELMCACQGLDLLTKGPPGPGTHEAYRTIREMVPALHHDRFLAPEIEVVRALIRNGEILRRVEERIGPME